jgi:serine/threonine protein kinase
MGIFSSSRDKAKGYFSEISSKPVKNKQILKLHRKTSPYHKLQKSAPSVKHSFLKFPKEIYEVLPGKSQGGHDAGNGSYSHVKYVLGEHHDKHVLKVDSVYAIKNRHPYDKETKISQEVGLFEEVGYREKAIKPSKGRDESFNFRYAVMPDCGVDLCLYLYNNRKTLTDQQRLHLAIKAAFQIHKLHSGLLSSEGNPIAHLDIKPENFYYDEETDTLTLGDYGFAAYGPIQKKATHFRYTPEYFPYIEHPFEIERYSLEALDIFAFKRTCFLPKKMKISGKDKEQLNEACYPNYILPMSLINKTKLAPYINTELGKKDFHTALFLTHVIILASISRHDLINETDTNFQKAVTVLYFADCLDTAHLKAICQDEYAKTISKLIDGAEKLKKSDIPLPMQAIETDSSDAEHSHPSQGYKV